MTAFRRESCILDPFSLFGLYRFLRGFSWLATQLLCARRRLAVNSRCPLNQTPHERRIHVRSLTDGPPEVSSWRTPCGSRKVLRRPLIRWLFCVQSGNAQTALCGSLPPRLSFLNREATLSYAGIDPRYYSIVIGGVWR